MSKALYVGSFDPLTKGHMYIIEEACEIFDEVLICIMNNSNKKNCFFEVNERLDIIKKIYNGNEKVSVINGSGASADVASYYGCSVIIRGLRNVSDFDYEFQLEEVNKKLSGGKVKTVCLFSSGNFGFVSSSIVRELIRLDKDVSDYVDNIVREEILRKVRKIWKN